MVDGAIAADPHVFRHDNGEIAENRDVAPEDTPGLGREPIAL